MTKESTKTESSILTVALRSSISLHRVDELSSFKTNRRLTVIFSTTSIPFSSDGVTTETSKTCSRTT